MVRMMRATSALLKPDRLSATRMVYGIERGRMVVPRIHCRCHHAASRRRRPPGPMPASSCHGMCDVIAVRIGLQLDPLEGKP